MDSIELPILLGPDSVLPEYKTEGSAGLDLACSESFELAPMERKLVATGLRISLPEGYEAQVRPRSGLAIKHGVGMVNSPGTIDSDYRGEIKVVLVNWGQDPVKFVKGDRIAQMVICPVTRANLKAVDNLDGTSRGDGGFGSTGL